MKNTTNLISSIDMRGKETSPKLTTMQSPVLPQVIDCLSILPVTTVCLTFTHKHLPPYLLNFLSEPWQ